MNFEPLPIEGALLVSTDRLEDDRGYFARLHCCREFTADARSIDFVQTSLSQNNATGTFRGMHFQHDPHGEIKLVRCIRGSVLDLILDLRPESSTYLQHCSVELSDQNQLAVLVPDGCAHGFLTLQDDTQLLYMIDRYYRPDAASGVRWDDPAFGIGLPQEITTINDRDASYPDYNVE